jgi:N utilization substance protein B
MARETALRVAYAQEMRSCSMEEVLQDALVVGDTKPLAYTVRLVTHMEQYVEQLDAIIKAKIVRWDFSRIAVLDRIILRMGVAEMLYFPDVPPKVTINEAIEIAKKFSTDGSGRFVNGILDAVYHDLSGVPLIPNGGAETGS